MAKVALLGHGIVGSGVAEVLLGSAKSIEKKAGEPVELKYILDIRDFPDCPYSDKIVKDFSVILNDPEIEVVIECIGGATFAHTFVKQALESGRHVVTSNKELIATKGAQLLKTARDGGANLFFEASVGGGTPVIRPMSLCLSANEITDVTGIINGTTNFILTKMAKEDMSFDDALQQAFKLGYAEQSDYSADVDGLDACRKICILSSLAYGFHLYPESVYTAGIGDITKDDIACAAENGYVIKPVAHSHLMEDGKVAAGVTPAWLSQNNQLSTVDDVFNGIVVHGDILGDVMFYGQGAGKLPTASAVVADVIGTVKNKDRRNAIYWHDSDGSKAVDFTQLSFKVAVRIKGADHFRPEAEVKALFPQVDKKAPYGSDMVFITPQLPLKEVYEKLEKLKKSGAQILHCAPVM